MIRRWSLARHAAALLVMTTAVAGCRPSWIPGSWLGRGAGGRPDPTMASAGEPPSPAALAARRDDLRARRQRGWDAVRAGAAPRGYSPDDARALSAVEVELDAAEPWLKRPARGRASLAELPRRYWWYLFVAPADWKRGPLSIDQDEAPGAYAALMSATESIVTAAADAALTADAYQTLHATTTFGVFTAEGSPAVAGYVWTPSWFDLIPLHDPGVTALGPLALSLTEMKAEGLATWNADVQRQHGDPVEPWLEAVLEPLSDINPHSKPVHLVYRRTRDASGAARYQQWLTARTDYGSGEAALWVAQWIAQYAAESKTRRLTGAAYLDALAAAEPSADALETLRPICRLVRSVQVGHVFVDGNARVSAMLLLNRLLRDQGLPPATVADVESFDGRAPLDQLARMVFDGQQRFQHLVDELAARDPAPGSPTPDAPAR